MLRYVALAAIFPLLIPALAPAQDMSVSNVLIEGQGWQLIGDGYKFTEGPAADAEGQV
jgi:gluconolactonase